MDQLRILIADDSEFMRIAYKRVLESQPDLRVVAMASDGEEAVAKAAEEAPDVAILDIRMPKLNGIKAAHRILDQHPHTGIVIISAYDDLCFFADLMQYGPERKAYLLKTSLSDTSELIRIVEAVNGGQTVLDPAIVQRLAHLYRKHSNSLLSALSEMEQDMLGLIAEGYDGVYIGHTLDMDLDQVAEHSASIFEKLGLTEGSEIDRRIKAIQAFVSQIHAMPLTAECTEAH